MSGVLSSHETRGEQGAGRREALHAAVRRAALPPSGQETQPWMFRLRGDDALELHADPGRLHSIADPHGREAIISCGAALFRVRVALLAAGHAGRVELLTDSTEPSLLARVRLGEPHVPTPADRALDAGIRCGWSDRSVYEARGIAPHILSLLLGAAREEGAWLGFVDTPVLRRALAGLVVAAHRRQRDDPRRRREHALRAHRNDGAIPDGLPATYPGGPAYLSYLGLPVPRAVGRDPAIAERVQGWVDRAATIAVLATRGDARADWLVAGQALARVLLTARAAGVAASYLNQPVEVPELRPGVAELVRAAADPGVPGGRGGMPTDAAPQVVLRLGHATEPRPAEPRPADALLPTPS